MPGVRAKYIPATEPKRGSEELETQRLLVVPTQICFRSDSLHHPVRINTTVIKSHVLHPFAQVGVTLCDTDNEEHDNPRHNHCNYCTHNDPRRAATLQTMHFESSAFGLHTRQVTL